MNFNDALAKALRYSTDTIHTLLTELQKPEYDHHRWGSDDIEPTQGLRGVLADAMDEQGRDTEANLLRTKGQHVLVDGQSKVRPARFTESPLFRAVGELADHIYANDSDAFDGWGSTFHGDADPVNPTDHEDYEPLGPNEHRLWEGEYEDFRHSKHHISNLGYAIADTVNDRIESSGDDLEEDEDDEDRWAEYDRLLNNVSNAPYEEVNTKHHTERTE